MTTGTYKFGSLRVKIVLSSWALGLSTAAAKTLSYPFKL